MITKQAIGSFRNDLDDALRAVCEKHGLTFKQGTASFNDVSFKMSITFGEKATLGDADPAFARDMARYGSIYGFSIEDIGKTFSTHMGAVQIMGMSRTKIIGRVSGKLYNFEPGMVADKLGRGSKVGSLQRVNFNTGKPE